MGVPHIAVDELGYREVMPWIKGLADGGAAPKSIHNMHGLATGRGYAQRKPVVSTRADLQWGIAMNSLEPAREGPDQSLQHPGQDHDSASASGPGSPKSRRQIIDEGFDYVLRHDAELLLRLPDA